MVCKKCGKVYCYSCYDIKSGKVKDNGICPDCKRKTKMKVAKKSATKKKEDKRFKMDGYEGTKKTEGDSK